MNLQSQFNNTCMQSQGLPGFATMGNRAIGTVVLFAVLLVTFLGLGDNPERFLFSLPQAQASASMDGTAEDFTPSQKHYIKRALHADYDNLIKLQGAAIRAALNEPEMVRADLPTIVWQYRSNDCVLDVYFKSEHENADLAQAVHYEMRHRKHGSDNFTGEQTCLKSIMPSMGVSRILGVSSIYKSYIQ